MKTYGLSSHPIKIKKSGLVDNHLNYLGFPAKGFVGKFLDAIKTPMLQWHSPRGIRRKENP